MTPTSAQCLVYMIIFSPFTLFLSLFNPSAAQSSSRSFFLCSFYDAYILRQSSFFFDFSYLDVYAYLSLYGHVLIEFGDIGLDWSGLAWALHYILYWHVTMCFSVLLQIDYLLGS